MSQFVWKWDDSSEFLQPRDAYICSCLVQDNPKPRLLEIGVWKGGWIFSMLRNHAGASAIGIDPYPVASIREKFLDAIRVRELNSRIKLFESIDELEASGNQEKFDLIHIDGEHTEKAVSKDLEFALKRLSPQGVIAVDDIFHGDFPGIAYAVFNFISRNPVSSFLISPGKMYICREINHQYFYTLSLGILKDAEIDFKTEFIDENSPDGYFQTNAIKGFKQVLVPEGELQALKYAKKLNIANKPIGLKKIIKKSIRLLLPEITLLLVRKIKSHKLNEKK